MLINYNTKALRPSLKVVHHLFESDFTEVNFEKAEYDQRLGRLKMYLVCFHSVIHTSDTGPRLMYQHVQCWLLEEPEI